MVLEEINENLSDVVTKELQKDSLKPFTLELINVIKDAQQQHGLRHGDFQRYRGYCSRRISRLRKALKIPQGDRRHFKRRDVTEEHLNNPVFDERVLHIPLMLAERSWAYAMQLRQESNTEQRKKFHMIRKLRKASYYALQLEELCKLHRCDARTKLETQAYVAWIHGSLHFELQMWLSAAENLKKAQVVYEKLASALPEDKQLPYKQRIDELTPSLRYCAYNAGEDQTLNLPELRTLGILENFDKFLLQSAEKSSAILHEVDWYDMKVPVRIEKVQLFLQTLVNFDDLLLKTETDSKRIEILENMFIDLRDVITAVRADAHQDDKDVQLLLWYLLSIRIERTIQRNMYLVKQSRKPQDIVRLLDITNQQLNDLMQLEPLQNKEEVQLDFSHRFLGFRSLKCFYLAKAHNAVHRWTEAFSCFERSLAYAKQAVEYDLPKDLTEMLKVVIDDAPSELVYLQSQAVLEQEEEKESPTTTQSKTNLSKIPLIDRLDEFYENPQYLTKNPNIVTMPPEMVSVPVKPLFYDLALNFINFPPLADKTEEAVGKQKDSGISGFVKGLKNANYTKTVLDNLLVPRVVGTPGHAGVVEYITKELQNLNYDIEIDQFQGDTPNFGTLTFKNIVATLNPTAEKFLVLSCHYDSKYFPNFEFIGATDAAASCAMILNLAKVLSKELNEVSKETSVSLKLVFFDGEEAFENWSYYDSLYGSKHLAESWEKNGRKLRDGRVVSHLGSIDLLVLLDLLGAPKPRIYNFFKDTENWYKRMSHAEKRLAKLGLLSNSRGDYFANRHQNSFIEDDHTPFLRKGVKILHLIPVPFPRVWHLETDNRNALDLDTIENFNHILRVFVAEYLDLSVPGANYPYQK
ncbi:hypothetical protein FQA39_LY04135 [Lamprigera yunnana]|nr:hypothetical protein FQA39_LY04135 [Lamprigera yunnana]